MVHFYIILFVKLYFINILTDGYIKQTNYNCSLEWITIQCSVVITSIYLTILIFLSLVLKQIDLLCFAVQIVYLLFLSIYKTCSVKL